MEPSFTQTLAHNKTGEHLFSFAQAAENGPLQALLINGCGLTDSVSRDLADGNAATCSKGR
jgi:hypothetical protein